MTVEDDMISSSSIEVTVETYGIVLCAAFLNLNCAFIMFCVKINRMQCNYFDIKLASDLKEL